MNKRILGRIRILIIGLFFLIALAQVARGEQMHPSWADHLDLAQVLIGALFLIIAWFIMRTVAKIDKNQTILFDKLSDLEKSHYTLIGEHNALAKMRGGKVLTCFEVHPGKISGE